MRKFKVFAAIAFFAVLVVIKFFAFPGVGAFIKEEAVRLLRYDPGRDKVIEAMKSTFGSETAPAEQDTEIPAYTVVRVSAEMTAEEPTNCEEGSCDGEELPVFFPLAVTTFLHAQEEFSDYELPENISYDYELLPFDYCVPVSGRNSSGFGYRLHPLLNTVKFHYGTDIAAWTGESILAFADGQVMTAEYSDSYGNYIVISHSDGWQSLYAHCSKLMVSVGDSVSAGETIALVGETGRVTGPHLHFELSHNGLRCNPEYYINDA